jgi:hypothetical protein
MSLQLPFSHGQLVVVILKDPREKMWGRLLGLESSGLAVRCLDVRVWEEVLALVKRGDQDQVALGTRFFPMHRVESFYLDEPSSGVPSLEIDFNQRTGMDAQVFLNDL